MEFLLALALVLLACFGLGLGLLFGRGPVTRSCGGCDAATRCATCPNHRDQP